MDSGDTNTFFQTFSTTPPPPSPSAAPRLSKKRSRPSRRTPTTVLATDTANFRAMVQIFTGIPLPSPFPLQNPLDFSSPPPLDPFSPIPQSNPSFAPISSLCSPLLLDPFSANAQYSHLMGSSEDLLALGGSVEAEDGVSGKRRLEMGECRLDSWICSSEYKNC